MRKAIMVLIGAMFVLAGCGDGPTEPEGVACNLDDGRLVCHE